MTIRADAAALSGLLPTASGRRMRLLRFRKRQGGLEGIPERYRLQFILLASERLPGRSPEEISAFAGQLAGKVKIPRHLLAALPHTDALDAWFKDNAGGIVALADGLVR